MIGTLALNLHSPVRVRRLGGCGGRIKAFRGILFKFLCTRLTALFRFALPDERIGYRPGACEAKRV